MGNRFGKLQSTETAAAPEQKTAAESAAAQPAEDSVIAQTQQAVETENLDVGVLEQVTQLASIGTEQLVLKSKVDEVPDADPEPVAKGTPALIQIQPVLPVCVSSASESAPLTELMPIVKAELTPEPEPEPVAEPEPVPESELVPEPEKEVKAVPEPMSVSVPAPATEQMTDLFSQESLPEPAISTLSDLGVLDQTPQPIDVPPFPATVTAPVDAEEPSDVPVTEECQDNAEISVIPTFEPEKSEETSESEEKPMEAEAPGNLEQLVSVVSGEESISGLLKNLELTGNDLVADLISTDVHIPDGMSTSTELM
ncbi:E3 ubiquitin-protein ligase RNF12-B-like [Clinocottus analis]|uniref:E3 ubiquitin-protein ligase RNF12-B-like n=1 Tax=Clinocottus analis TaxID=304258 RepID=UPI0035C035FB